MTIKISGREKRHLRLRKRIIGTAERPRLNVRRSLKNLFIQIIDDSKRVTLLSVSTTDKNIRSKITYGGNIKAAVLLGDTVAQMAKGKNIVKVVFDRGGYDYHGRIRAFAEAARKGGLEF
ncbi:MAG: 50S ribosomal protein L18 [Candidatus Omnitrophica bacterium CG1_02_44_16]|nr:MAG: 50S ribosomal protein L18 [Candidatus Omnitrophica bacterium CG1_02_44_16]PIY82810.1 MAG: 50S ribosomal protein L18 [Candidatus Omnitrophica bacterium CG_4_10_14_0_8_um_filter_44_12]